jgi:hypothetical protein
MKKAEKKGAPKPKPRCFERELEELVTEEALKYPNMYPNIPGVISITLKVLETIKWKEGIFRISGNLTIVGEISTKLDEENCDYSAIQKELEKLGGTMEGQFALATLLKKYLLALPDPIIPYALYDKFLEATIARQEIQRIQGLTKMVKELSIVRYETLKVLSHLFHRIQLESKENAMTAENLGTAVGPSILRGKFIGSSKSLQDLKFVSMFLAALAKYYHYIFEGKTMVDLEKEFGIIATDTPMSPLAIKRSPSFGDKKLQAPTATATTTTAPIDKKDPKIIPPPVPKRSSQVIDTQVIAQLRQPTTVSPQVLPLSPLVPIRSPPPKPLKETRPSEEVIAENHRLVNEIFAAKGEIIDLKILLDQARDEIISLKAKLEMDAKLKN